MRTEVTIRPARIEDMEAVLPLAREMATSFEVRQQPFADSFREIIEEAGSICLVAERGDDLIGYLIGFDHKAFYANGRVSWVEEIFVIESHRREAIGRKLMEAFEAWCDERGSKLIGLATRRASAFYAALGYEESATFFRKVLPQDESSGPPR